MKRVFQQPDTDIVPLLSTLNTAAHRVADALSGGGPSENAGRGLAMTPRDNYTRAEERAHAVVRTDRCQ